MRRTEALQGARIAMFLNILHRWESAELNQAEGAELLGVGERTFRRCRSQPHRERFPVGVFLRAMLHPHSSSQ